MFDLLLFSMHLRQPYRSRLSRRVLALERERVCRLIRKRSCRIPPAIAQKWHHQVPWLLKRWWSGLLLRTLTDNDQSLIAVPPEFVWKLGNGWLVWTDEARMLRSFSSAASPEPATPPRSSWAEAPLLRFPLSRSLDLSLLVPCVSLSCEFLSVLRRALKSSVFPRSRHGFQRE